MFSANYIIDIVCCAECEENEVKCKTGFCLPRRLVCDSFDNCGDGSDEVELCGELVLLLNCAQLMTLLTL